MIEQTVERGPRAVGTRPEQRLPDRQGERGGGLQARAAGQRHRTDRHAEGAHARVVDGAARSLDRPQRLVRVAVQQPGPPRRDLGGAHRRADHVRRLASLGHAEAEVGRREAELVEVAGADLRVVLEALDRAHQGRVAAGHEADHAIGPVRVDRPPHTLDGHGQAPGRPAPAHEHAAPGIQTVADRPLQLRDPVGVGAQRGDGVAVDLGEGGDGAGQVLAGQLGQAARLRMSFS